MFTIGRRTLSLRRFNRSFTVTPPARYLIWHGTCSHQENLHRLVCNLSIKIWCVLILTYVSYTGQLKKSSDTPNKESTDKDPFLSPSELHTSTDADKLHSEIDWKSSGAAHFLPSPITPAGSVVSTGRPGVSLGSVFESVQELSIEASSDSNVDTSSANTPPRQPTATRRNSTLLNQTAAFISGMAAKPKEVSAPVDQPMVRQSTFAKVSMAPSQPMFEALLKHLNADNDGNKSFRDQEHQSGIDDSSDGTLFPFMPLELPSKVRSPAESWIIGKATLGRVQSVSNSNS